MKGMHIGALSSANVDIAADCFFLGGSLVRSAVSGTRFQRVGVCRRSGAAAAGAGVRGWS